MRMIRHFLSLLLSSLVLSFLWSVALCDNEAIRCRQVWLPPSEGDNDSEEDIWTFSACSKCSNVKPHEGSPLLHVNKTNVLMFLGELEFAEGRELFNSFLTLAAGLLVAGSNVLMLYTTVKQAPSPELIKESIFYQIPCEDRFDAASRFDLVHTSWEVDESDVERPCSSVFCHLGHYQRQAPLLDASTFMNQREQLDLIVAFGLNTVAIGVAENHSLPILLFVENAELLPPSFPNPTVSNVLSSIWEHTRIYRLVNLWRTTVGLPRLRHLSDLWSESRRRSFLTPFSPNIHANRRDQWMLQHGLIPPCVKCADDLPDVGTEFQTVLVVDTSSRPLQPHEVRGLWQGLSLAKASRERHCEMIGRCKELDIVLVTKMDYANSNLLLPSSIRLETMSPFDSFARHDPFAVVMVECKNERVARWTKLPVPALCFNRKSTPRGIALQILKVLHQQENITNGTTTIEDDLMRLVQNLDQLVRMDSTSTGGEELPRRHWLVLVAWGVALSSVVVSSPVLRRYRRGRRSRIGELSLLSFVMGSQFVDDLSELDAVWDMSVAWLSRQLSLVLETKDPVSRRSGERSTAKRRAPRPK